MLSLRKYKSIKFVHLFIDCFDSTENRGNLYEVVVSILFQYSFRKCGIAVKKKKKQKLFYTVIMDRDNKIKISVCLVHVIYDFFNFDNLCCFPGSQFVQQYCPNDHCK